MKKRELSRRSFIRRSGAIVGVAAAAGILGAGGSARASVDAPEAVPSDPTRVPGRGATPYGHRSRFDTRTRAMGLRRSDVAYHSLTPLEDLDGVLTPSSLHFERHHAGVPLIDPARHRLMIHGLLRRPLVFTMTEVKRFPSVSRLCFIECSGNTYMEWERPRAPSAHVSHGLLSCSEWTGTPLRCLLKEVGARAEASWVIAEGGDAAVMARSIPMAKCLDDAIVAWAQNGEDIRPEQGFPLRLILPGWEGSANVKWLRRLKLVSRPAESREETAKYTDLMPDGTARQFTFVMEAKSVITSPSGGHKIGRPGFHEIRGLAWSGRGAIARVEVSLDGGESWHDAELQHPVLPKCCTRFRFPWIWDGRETVVQSRAVDETGYVQPTRQELVAARGHHSLYHFNGIHGWRVKRSGDIVHV